MTIKQWFYKHPNITFILLFLFMSYMLTKTFQHLANAEWIRAVFSGLAAVVALSYTVRWWENEQ